MHQRLHCETEIASLFRCKQNSNVSPRGHASLVGSDSLRERQSEFTARRAASSISHFANLLKPLTAVHRPLKLNESSQANSWIAPKVS
jgi:hypothetical protein